MSASIPNFMQAVLLEQTGGPATAGQVPIPRPRPGHVLVRMAASPINPSDLGFIKGSYGFQKPFPVVPGFEGSGVVVAAGHPVQALVNMVRVQGLAGHAFQTSIQKRFPFARVQDAMAVYQENPTAGQVLLMVDSGGASADEQLS